MDLVSLGASHVSMSGTEEEKEFHFFDNWVGLAGKPVHRQAQQVVWQSMLPDCPRQGHFQQVLMDATPCNMRMIPLPSGTRPTGSHWGRWFLVHDERTLKYSVGDEMDLPQTLQDFYQDDARKLIFVVMLREPLSRMQSAWYHSHEGYAEWAQCRDCKAPSFQQALNSSLSKAQRSTPTYDDWLWASLYGRQIEYWLSKFDAHQFVILPYRQYTQGDRTGVCLDIAKRLEKVFDCKALSTGNATFANFHEHPTMDQEELPHALKTQFDSFIEAENTRLAGILAKAQVRGAGLPGYAGPIGDKDEIQRWVELLW